MSESFEELDKQHKKLVAFRVELYKMWKASGSDLSQSNWVAKFVPDKFEKFNEANRIAEIVLGEYKRQDRERRATMSDLEKLHEKLMVVAMEILDAWACSGSHLKQDKWVEEYMPEKLEIYHRSKRVFREVMAARTRLQSSTRHHI